MLVTDSIENFIEGQFQNPQKVQFQDPYDPYSIHTGLVERGKSFYTIN